MSDTGVACAADANNRTTSYGYDGLNRLTSVTASGGAETTYSYDAAGNLLTRTDAKNHVTSYVYDPADRLTQMTLPLNRQWTYAYDAAGNRTSTVNANGNATQTGGDGTTSYSYDRSGRLTGIDYSDATPDVTYTYDGADNRTQMTDGAGTQTYTYDPVNQLTGVSRGDTFSYLYDLAGNLTRRTYPDTTQIDYGYDDDSRMATVASGGETTSYAYDAAGNLTATTLPASNGHVEERTYDRAGRLTRIKSVKGADTLVDHNYTLDPVGNPTQVIRAGTAAGTTTYTYDNRDRLTEVCYQASCPGGSDPFIRWTYDAVGNRLTEARPAGASTYTYNAADELTSAGSMTFSYDANGNQTQKGTASSGFNLRNELVSVSGGSTATYTYDGEGYHRTATIGGSQTNFLWDFERLLPEIALERAAAGALIRRHIYGHDRVTTERSGSSDYFHHDRIGSVANVTSSTGARQWTYTYDPFGETRTETQDDPLAAANPMRFTGEYADADGLYYFRARHYDTTTGRFPQDAEERSPNTLAMRSPSSESTAAAERRRQSAATRYLASTLVCPAKAAATTRAMGRS